MFTRLLAQRAAENRPIRVGIIGAGKFGAGLVAQLSQMRGMEASVIADIKLDNAKHAYAASGIPADTLVLAHNANAIDDAIRAGKRAVTQDGLLIAHADQIDVVVEATGIPEVGARMAFEAIARRKHVVMVNVEADVTIGAILRRQADSAGVVYTLVDGDQPGCTMNMIEWARTLGFEIVAARGTVYYADDRAGTPDTVPQRFGFSDEVIRRRTINLKMYNSFRDGTKAQVEMTALANAAGLVPDVRGMHEPSVNIAEIARAFSLRGVEGGLLSRHGVVELANSVAPDGKTLLPNGLGMGVFAVIHTDHPFTQEDLRAYFLHPGGDGHNYLLYRPYHLVAVEAPISIALAALYGQATASPLPTPSAEVITVAKRDLKCGEILDGGGGYTVNGICETAATARAERLLPLGLATGAKLKQEIAQGSAITYDMVEMVEDSFVLKLRRLQDAIVPAC